MPTPCVRTGPSRVVMMPATQDQSGEISEVEFMAVVQHIPLVSRYFANIERLLRTQGCARSRSRRPHTAHRHKHAHARARHLAACLFLFCGRPARPAAGRLSRLGRLYDQSAHDTLQPTQSAIKRIVAGQARRP